MSAKPDDRLRQLLRDEAGRTVSETLENPQRIPLERIQAVTRVAELADIRDALNRRPPRRWAAPLLLGVSLVLVSILAFSRVTEAEIELDARLAEVELIVASDVALLLGTDLVAIGITGADHVSIRSTPGWPGLELSAAPGESLGLEISAEREIALEPVHVKAGTRVRIQQGPDRDAVRLTLRDNSLQQIEASLAGAIRLAGTHTQPQEVEFKTPRRSVFHAGPYGIIADLTMRDRSWLRFSPQFAVRGFFFNRVVSSDTEDRPFSSVLSGSLYLEDVNGKEVKLRDGQRLEFTNVAGTIRRVELLPNSIGLQFHGSTEGIVSGSPQHPRSLMPTRLDWLRAQHGLALLWGTALYVFGVTSGVLNWLRLRI